MGAEATSELGSWVGCKKGKPQSKRDAGGRAGVRRSCGGQTWPVAWSEESTSPCKGLRKTGSTFCTRDPRAGKA